MAGSSAASEPFPHFLKASVVEIVSRVGAAKLLWMLTVRFSEHTGTVAVALGNHGAPSGWSQNTKHGIAATPMQSAHAISRFSVAA